MCNIRGFAVKKRHHLEFEIYTFLTNDDLTLLGIKQLIESKSNRQLQF